MIIYLASFIFCILLHYFSEKSKSRLARNFLIFIPLLWLALLAGFRDFGVGTDTEFYSDAYFKAALKSSGFVDLLTSEYEIRVQNKGYLVLNYIGTFFLDDIFIAWFLTELLILTCTYVAVLKMKKMYDLRIYLFSIIYLFAFYNVSLNIMRQMCALSILLLSYVYYLEKKRIATLLLFFIAISFHTTSGIFVLAFLYDYLSKTKHKMVLLFAIVCILFIGLITYYQLLMFLGNMGVFSEVYMDRYGESSEYEGVRVPYAFVCVAFMIYIGIYLAYKKRMLLNCESFFVLLIHSSFLILMTMNFLAETLIRLSFYFYAVDLLYVAIMMTSKRRSKLFNIAFVSIIIIMWGYSYMYLNGNATYPYKSKILGI